VTRMQVQACVFGRSQCAFHVGFRTHFCVLGFIIELHNKIRHFVRWQLVGWLLSALQLGGFAWLVAEFDA